MGVSISLYTGLEFAAKSFEETNNEGVYLHNLDDFKDHSNFIEGVYKYAEQDRFLEQPYSSFNRCRQNLAESLGYPPFQSGVWGRSMGYTFYPPRPDGLFKMLFSFADNEGHWDCHCCQLLKADFEKYRSSDYELPAECEKWFEALEKHVALCAGDEGSAIVFS